MKFCPFCGSQIQLDNIKFCPECGKEFIGEKNELSALNSQIDNTNSLLLKDVEDSYNFVTTVYSEYDKISDYDSFPYENEVISGIKRKSLFKSLIMSISIPVLLAIIFNVIDSMGRKNSTVNVGAATPGPSITTGITTLLILIPVLWFIFYKLTTSYKYIGKTSEYKKCQVEVAQTKRKIEKQNSLITTRIRELMKSEDGKKALNIIPQDYFYPQAVKMILFYLKNGQADTMKEALKEFDQYLHRCKLEYEAERTANASERTAKSAEKAANAAIKAANNSAAIRDSMYTVEQYASSTNFWTIYNALK